MKPLYVHGLGLWAPGFGDVTAWREGRADPEIVKPMCSIVNARLKRGSSRFANMLGEVVSQATEDAGVAVGTVATVYGSSLGEVTTMVTLLRMLYEEEGRLSPNRFKNSVHNAASGLISIGTSNTGFSTAIAGGARTFERSLVEAWGYLHVEGGSLVLAVGDDRPPEPLDQLDDYGALALAFCLSAEPPEDDGAKSVQIERFERGVGRRAEHVPAEFAGNCAAPGLALLEAVISKTPGPVSVSPVSATPSMIVHVNV